MADAWEEAAKKYAAQPTAKATKEPASGSVWDTTPVNLNPGSPSESVGRFAEGFANAVNPIPGISAIVSDPQGLKHGVEENIFRPQVEQFGKAADAARGKGEFEGMGPIGRASEAFGHGLAGAVPLVGPSAANAGDQIGNGDVAGGLGSAAGLVSTAATPLVTRGLGRGLQKSAEPFFDAAVGNRNIDRAPGKTPARAGLDLTSGVTLPSIAKSADAAIGGQAAARDAAISANPQARPSLRPALDEIEAAKNKGAAGNSDMSHLEPMRDQLTTPRPGFSGATQGNPLTISELQDPQNFLALRQRFGNDFTKFDTARPLPDEALKVGNRAYSKLTDELHSAVPETADPDRNISNLIPVRDNARAKALNASLPQRMIGRMAARTGALTGAAYGHHVGGIPGAIAGFVIPELTGDPVAQAIAARGLNSAGSAMQKPITGRIVQGVQNVKPLRRTDEDQ